MEHSHKRTVFVHKFGGSSLINAESFQAVKSRLTGKDEIIIVSATKGTTSKLQQLLDNAKADQEFNQGLQALEHHHIAIINQLCSGQAAKSLCDEIKQDSSNISDLLHATRLVKDYSKAIQALVIGYGEHWSAKILNCLLGKKAKSRVLIAARVLYTYEKLDGLHIDWQRAKVALDEFLAAQSYDQLVITGFLACDRDGKQIILGRNGSDFSAAIFAKLMNAKALMIWKDVDGIYSADPTRVRAAFPIEQLSYESALELAYFGAAVIHPKTIAPAMACDIPIYIKNIRNPDALGTCISSQAPPCSSPVQGLTSIDHVSLINIEGTGLIGVSGTAARVFQLLQQADISVILISQASSEHSICIAVQSDQAQKAVAVLEDAFSFEIQQNRIEGIFVDNDCAILAAVGDGMVGTVGIAGKLTGTLAKANVNIRAIAQGSSERNISVVVNRHDINKALRAVHAGFYLSNKTLSIGIIGPGLVGQTLIKQIAAEQQRLAQQHHVSLRVRGICKSKTMLLSDEIDLTNWQQQLEKNTTNVNLTEFCRHIVADDIPHAVIIDCTANQDVANQYVNFVKRGAHIITPNKRTNAGDYDYYCQLRSLAQKTGRHYLYETTVCAGLPVITTLTDIIQTGDKVVQVQGVVSGTLSYIFSQFNQGKPFAQIIHDAKAKGYTEPDPREDLTGMDVARKVVILARELGHRVKLDEVEVFDLVPAELKDCDSATFLEKLPEYEDTIKAQINTHTKAGEVPVYLGTIKQDGSIDVGIKSFPNTHPFARLRGTDNMLIFTTKRYDEQPLVIQGPGAGAEVTAAGVFGDLLRLVSFIAS